MRVFVIFGQGGIVTSFGMYLLAQRIRVAFPAAKVTTHGWSDTRAIVKELFDTTPTAEYVALIGYSLGANAVTQIAAETYHEIDLAVAYDPSILGQVKQPGGNIKRLLLYHNTSIEPFGHARFTGPMVETTETAQSHLAVCWDRKLHDKTMTALAHLARLVI